MKKYVSGLRVLLGVGLLFFTLESDLNTGIGQTLLVDTQRSNNVESSMLCQEGSEGKKVETKRICLLAGLKITMFAQLAELRKGESAPLSVRIENNSDEDLGPSFVCFIELVKESDNELEKERENYSSLIRLKDQLMRPGNPSQESVLEKSGALEVKVDLTKLEWEQSISSSGIAQNLFQIVPHGYYDLRFVILIYYKNPKGETFTKRVMSNEMSVFVHNDL